MKITTRFSLKFWHEFPSRSICGFSLCPWINKPHTGRLVSHRAAGKAFRVCPQGSGAGTSWGQGRSEGCSLSRLSERAAHSSQQQSPHIVSALAPQNTKRWIHSGSCWCFKGVEGNTWPQHVFPCRKENSPERAGSPCGDGSPCGEGSKAKFSKWFHSQLKFIPLTCRACDSRFTVSSFQFTNTGWVVNLRNYTKV